MEVIIQNNMIEMSDGITKSSYALDCLPKNELPLVLEARESILQEIDLKDMLTNLNNAGDLIFVAFCALNGKRLQADLDGLQSSLLKLCEKSKNTMVTFRNQSKEITLQILSTYNWLRKGMPQQAMVIFRATGEYAAQMSAQSKALSNEFMALSDQTILVMQKAEVEHATEIEHKQKYQEELLTMQAEKAAQEKLSQELQNDLVEINAEYQEEKDKLASAEKESLP